MSVLSETNIFRSEDLAVDFFSWGDGLNKTVAITFTPFGVPGAVLIDGAGFAGEILLRNDFDVVAFKSTKNVWYQNISPEILTAVETFIAARAASYTKRVGYGSSMGGYAAIQFSRSLKLDVVLALSPQFEIDKPYDTRWHAAAQLIEFKYRIDGDAISRDCKYFVAYDPATEDLHHVEKLRELISSDRLVEIVMPFSGHPVGYYLVETGLLKDLTMSVLKEGTAEHVSVGTHRKRSKTYLYEMSRRLVLRGKYGSAFIAVNRAISLDDGAPDLHVHRSIILDYLGRPKDALMALHEARRRMKNDAQLMGEVSDRLARHGDYVGALELVDKAIAIDDRDLQFHLHKCAICKVLGDLPGEISAGEFALNLSPANTSIMKRLSLLYARKGGFAAWSRSLSLAWKAKFSRHR
jgi:tetratricopeptide (TPR) repeat protein